MDGCLQHSEIINRVEKLENEVREITKRQCDTERITSRFDVRFDNIIDKINELKIKIDEIAKVPSKRWDLVVVVLITSCISTAISIIIPKLIK